MNVPTDFFQVGGTLSEDAKSYIERPADKELFSALKVGELCLVLAPRQMGKSSLMVRTIFRLREEGIRAGYVDLQLLGSQRDPNRWFGAVVNQITRSLKLKENSIKWWRTYNQLDATQRFANFLEDVVLQEIQGNVVLSFDEIDSVLPLPFSDDFFTTIRSIYNKRATNPTLKRLTFVLLGVATVSSFIRDRTRTSFNVGRSIVLDDFDRASIGPLRKVLGEDSDPLIERIFYWTNGQPYLVQKLAFAAYSWESKERSPARIDEEVNRTYLQDKIEQDIHLKFIQDYLLAEYEVSVREKLKVYREVLVDKRIPYNKQSLVQNNLKLSGIVRVKDKQLVLHNRIYEDVFNLQWVQKHAGLTDEELTLLSDARRPAFVPGYTYDIFVSYTHVDDIPSFGADQGWVTTFVEELQTQLTQKLGRKDVYKLWIDPELAENVHITSEIMKALRNTAIFMIILSRGYLASDWCRRWAKNRFLSLVQERLRSGSRVFFVEIDRIEDNERPREFGFEPANFQFWKSGRQGKPPHRLGIPQQSSLYYEELNKLSYDLVNELQKLKDRAVQFSGKASPVWLAMTPYPGLRPFECEEAHIFVGRDEQIEQLLEKISYTRFISVVGPSGCGKTSLVRAGLIATLGSGDFMITGVSWQVVEMLPDNAPFRNLSRALLSHGFIDEGTYQEEDIMTFLQCGSNGFVELLHEASFPKHTNLLLFIDQFESLFRSYYYGNRDDVKAFVAFLLASAKQNEIPIYVVTTMRSEFVGDCALFHGLPEVVNLAQFMPPCMTREQLEKAITSPAIVFGGEVDKQLVERLLEDIDTKPNQLPLLQHCLQRMWLHAKSRVSEARDSTVSESITMTLEDYEATGELKNALPNHAEEVFRKLNKKQQRIAKYLFRRLSDRRRFAHHYISDSVQVSEIAAIAEVPIEEVIEVAEIFRLPDCHFITSEALVQLEPDSVLHISYESLIRQWPRLDKWEEQETKSAETYRHLEQAARLWKEGKAALWSTPELENALAWREQEKPMEGWANRYGDDFALSMKFLDASARNRKRKRQFNFLLILLGLILIASLATWGVWESSINEELRQHLNVPQILISDTDGFLQNEIYYLECGETVTISVRNYWLNSKFNIDYKAAIGKVGLDGQYTAPNTPGMDVLTITVTDKKTQKIIAHKSILIEIVDPLK